MMMAKPLIVSLTKGRLPPSGGKKAANLRKLADKGFRVPKTWVCTWEAHERYLQDNPNLIAELSRQLGDTISTQQAYAIRSSANLEDSLHHSYAGQFESILNVCGLEPVLQAISSIWSSVQSETVSAYQEKRSLEPGGIRMAVLIQEMVDPQLSGVAFSKNPMTAMDEVLVEAVQGPGSLLVQEGVNPLRWVNKWGTWLQQSQEPGIDLQVIETIVQQTREISQEMDSDVDLEWVYNGSQVYWVQMRNITAVPNLNIYSNRIAREMLPGQIKPLIWSINTRLINQVWVKLIDEAIGATGIDPDSLTRAFYYRTYFNMGIFGQVFKSLGLPRESLEIMMGIVPAEVRKPRFRPPPKLILKSPRLLRFMLDKLRFSTRIDRFLPQAKQALQSIPHSGLEDRPPDSLFAEIDRIYAITSQVAYYNIVGPLLNFLYHSVLIRQLKHQEIDYKKLDLASDLAELKDYDPNHHLAALHERYLELSEPVRQQILVNGTTNLTELAAIGLFNQQMRAFQQQLEGFISRFGHFSDSGNDFSAVPWREKPEVILELITQYQPAGQEQSQRTKFDQLKTTGLRGRFLRTLYRRSRQYSLYREQISSLYTYSYGLFRPYYLALANQLVQQNALSCPDDIFFLYASEIRALRADASLAETFNQQIESRKMEMQASQDVPLPEIIYGDEPPPIMPINSDTLVGTATSRGYYSGPVKVIRGLSEFSKMQPGDVLVVPFSDVGWTPLFAKAGAVIADSGGMLSHSSIIAREYNIPAVVSVPGSLNLPDGAQVTVDGFKGEIIIHADSAIESQPEIL
jgi:phosphoenolpyruvate synthase/pyruvate phosphate dikinase